MKSTLILFLLSFLFSSFLCLSVVKTKGHIPRSLLSDEEKAAAKGKIFAMVKGELAKFPEFVIEADTDVLDDGGSVTYNMKVGDSSAFPAFKITDKTVPDKEDQENPYELVFEKIGGTSVIKRLSVSLLSDYEEVEPVKLFIKRSVEGFMMKMLQVPGSFDGIVDETINMIKFVFTKESGEGNTDFIASVEEQEDKKTDTDRGFVMKLMSSEFDKIEMLIKQEVDNGVIQKVVVDLKASYFDINYVFNVITIPFIVNTIESALVRIKLKLFDPVTNLNKKEGGEAESTIKKKIEEFKALQEKLGANPAVKEYDIAFEKKEHNRLQIELKKANEEGTDILSNVYKSIWSPQSSMFNPAIIPGLFMDESIDFLYKITPTAQLKELLSGDMGENREEFYSRLQEVNVPFIDSSNVEGEDLSGFRLKADNVAAKDGCVKCVKHVMYEMKSGARRLMKKGQIF